MLFIFILLSIVISFLLMREKDISEYGVFVAAITMVVGIVSFFTCFVMLFEYFEVKYTNDKQIAIIQEENELLKKQLKPIIERYLNHETETFEKIKIDGDNVVAYGMFPELKGNKIVQEKNQVIINNQDRIMQLKLEKAKLNKYKFWLFMGE